MRNAILSREDRSVFEFFHAPRDIYCPQPFVLDRNGKNFDDLK